MSATKASLKRMKDLAAQPLTSDCDIRRVEIVMLKFREEPEVIDKAISRIIHNTDWPFKLTVYDNRPNNANTSRVWNRLVSEATCRYILIIDSDAFVPARKTDPCWLTRMMESIDETGIVIPVSSSTGGAEQHVNGPKEYPAARRNKGIWSGYCFLIDLDRMGNGMWMPEGREQLFDERFYIYGQDSEFAHRAAKYVGGAMMREDVFVEHMGGYSFKQDPVRDEDKFYARELFLYLTKK